MICVKLVLFISVLKLSDSVKVNMLGSLSLGQEVIETLSHFVNKNKLSGRRSIGYGVLEDEKTNIESDTIALIVNSAFLCRDLNFCHGPIGTMVNEYIIMLTKAVETVFEGLIDDADKKLHENTVKTVIFEEELRRLIQDTKKLLLKVNEKITDENEALNWINLIKRISAKFQERAISFASQRLEGNVEEIAEVKKKLTQKLVIATSVVELKYEATLCDEHNICSKSHECTKSLNTLLEQMKTVSDDRAKEFVRYFYETLPNTNFYYRISDITGHEFQSILHDMGYSENIPTQKVLSIVQKTVEDRLNAITSNYKKHDSITSGRDVKLVHIILSDMDHFYNKQKKEPFHDFLSDFFEWSKQGGRFSSPLRHVMKDIQSQLSYEADEIVMKLINEVRVFMEITVDPDP